MRLKRLLLQRELRLTLLAVILFLCLLEGVLRLLHVAPFPDRELSLANNQNPTEPLWVAERLSKEEGLFYVPAVDQHARPFPTQKTSSTFRIVALGGSATHGFGMSENGAFPHRLWQLLAPLEPDRDVQVLNLGTIAWASQQQLWLTKQVLKKISPDLFVLYIGNNELLEAGTVRRFLSPSHFRRWMNRVEAAQELSRIRTFLLLRSFLRPLVSATTDGTRTLANLPVLPDAQRAVLGPRARRFAAHQLSHHLERILGLCREAGVPVVLATVAVNLRDPPVTYPAPDSVAQRWQELMDKGGSLEALLKNREARVVYEEANSVWESAEGYWRLGRVLEGLKEKDGAYQAYVYARDWSQNPSRAVSEVQKATRDLAARWNIPLFDAEEAFRRAAADGIPSFDLFYDYCHPTVKGHWILAAGIARTIVAARLLGEEPPGLDFDVAAQRWLEAFSVRHDDFLRVDEWLGIAWNPQPVYHPDSRDAMRAVYQAAREEGLKGGAVEKVLWGNAAFHTAQRIGPSHVGGTLDEALEAWQQALDLDPTLCVASANQGYLFASTGAYARAAEAYAKAAACQPASSEWVRWARWATHQKDLNTSAAPETELAPKKSR